MTFARTGAFLGLLVVLGVGLPQTARPDLVTPLSPIPQRTPWTTRYEKGQFHLHEAQTKGRLLAKGLAADLAGTRNATENMSLYDVHFYDLDLDLDPVSRVLIGTMGLAAEVTGAEIATLDLNLEGNMVVSEVRAAGGPVSFSHADRILTITLDRTYLQGEEVVLAVDYAGNPESEYFGWSSYGGYPLIWTLSEPYGARKWWPCKDLNTDKADSLDITVTVPEILIVASNGLLAAETTPEAGKKSYEWRERYPIATYLVSLTAHPYTVLHDEYHTAAGDTMPLDYYIVPDRYNDAMSYAIIPDMLAAFAGAFDEYPFVEEKYGHVHFPWFGGMEHQTMTSLHYGVYDQGIQAHELAHQWFGDLVTCADFSHIWLNEGFATWLEAYWREVHEGTAAYHAEMADARYTGPGTIFVENPLNPSVIFDYDLTYRKASWVPHMLRHVMGEDDFFAAVRLYLATYGHGSATTEQFQAVMEDVSGLDLEAFFQQWIYGAHYPIYRFSYGWWPADAGYNVTLRVEQTQTLTGLFTMPLDVRVTTSVGTEDFVIQNSAAISYYSFHLDDEVTGVTLDPDHWVLRDAWDDLAAPLEEKIPTAARLTGNAPNPFNPATEIRFHLPADEKVRLAVFDVSGRLVKTLVDEVRPAGENAVRWDGTDRANRSVASGTYFARLTTAAVREVRPMSLVR